MNAQIDTVTTVNIEKAILSSLFFNIEEEVLDFLHEDDFYHLGHRRIYKEIKSLYKEQMPIDEDFVRKRIPREELSDNVLLDVLSANPITNSYAYAQEIKEESNKRSLEGFGNKIKSLSIENDSDYTIKTIEEDIKKLKKNSVRTPKDWKAHMKKQGGFVTTEFLKEIESVEMLFNDFLPKNQVTTLVGEPNVGKSALTFCIINHLFQNDLIDHLFYFDPDNPISVTKDRIEKLIADYGEDRIMYYTGATCMANEMLNKLEDLSKFERKGGRVLIIMDGYQKFIEGSINEDKNVKPLMDAMQTVRDKFGANIIGLHHTNRTKVDGKLQYLGSQLIKALTDNMFYLKKDASGTILIENDKLRAAKIKPKLAYNIDFDNMTLEETAYVDSEEKMDFIEWFNAWDGEKMDLKTAQNRIENPEMIDIYKKGGNIRMEKIDNNWMISKSSDVRMSEEPVVVEFESVEMPSVV